MPTQKCNYTIYSKENRNKQGKLALKLNDEPIEYEKNQIILGIKFDEALNFGAQIKKIREKCMKAMNIIKILSHKSWLLTKKT